MPTGTVMAPAITPNQRMVKKKKTYRFLCHTAVTRRKKSKDVKVWVRTLHIPKAMYIALQSGISATVNDVRKDTFKITNNLPLGAKEVMM